MTVQPAANIFSLLIALRYKLMNVKVRRALILSSDRMFLSFFRSFARSARTRTAE